MRQINKKSPITGQQRKNLLDKIISECREKADSLIRTWKPIDPSWPTVDGCAYLRLSTDEQVAVEKGSLEQQIYIAVSEAEIRSKEKRVNFRIRKFFIEPGITGRTDNRPEFQTMLGEIRASKHKFVVIKELARIARETSVWKDFFNLCIKSDCEIMIRSFPFNPNDPAQIFQLDILAAFAEYESNQNSRRVRESVFSAMVTSGKFNSTHRVLGLKQLTVNDEPQVGFYVHDHDELKSVALIMETFVKYGSYAKTLEECNRLGIKNWNGRPFKLHALVNLLKNTRYIGKWELNAENKDKDQSRLMPYHRHAIVDLPHGCLIDIELWNRVQTTIEDIKGRKDRTKNKNRVYPLSGGILLYKDGSRFAGASAWKDVNQHTYYVNKENDLRLVAEAVESETRRIVGEIIRSSPKLQEAVTRHGKDRIAASEIYSKQVTRLEADLRELEAEKKALDRRLDFVIDGMADTEAQEFKKDYREEREQLGRAIMDKKAQIDQAQSKAAALRKDEFNWKDLGKRCEAVLTAIQEKDPAALKTAYRDLFAAIIVGDVGADGGTELKFVLKGQNVVDFLDFVNGRKKSSIEKQMAREEGIEPPTRRLTAVCSTAELLPNTGTLEIKEPYSECQERHSPDAGSNWAIS